MTEGITNGVEWKEIDPAWKPNTGDQISGVLLKKEDGGQGISAKYYIDTAEGEKLVWGSTILDDLMRFIESGTLVRITFLGKEKTPKGRDVNQWKVEEGNQKKGNQSK